MFNHARTLLLNVRGDNAPGPAFPWEEAVPVPYRPFIVPSFLTAIRNVLFGMDPDRYMLNYRLRQFMTLLHATELEEHILALDPRVSYPKTPERDSTLFGIKAEGSTRQIFFDGSLVPDDNRGRLGFDWRVSVNNGGVVTVLQTTPPARETDFTPTVTDGLTAPVLLGQGISASVDPTPGTVWHVSGLAAPGRDLPSIVAALRQIGESRLIQLFGAKPVEPYKTFAALWNDHFALPYQLGGLLGAAVYRSHEIWMSGARVTRRPVLIVPSPPPLAPASGSSAAPSSSATLTPSSSATLTPSSSATLTPSSSATLTPSSSATLSSSSATLTSSSSATLRPDPPAIPHVLADMDFHIDPDDLAGYGSWIRSHQAGEIVLLGIGGCTSNQSSPKAMRAVDTWAGVTVPHGIWKNSSFLEADGLYGYYYAANLAGSPPNGANFAIGTGLRAGDYVGPWTSDATFSATPELITFYRTQLAAAADNSVTIYAGGPLKGLSGLLDSPADGISPLTGAELIELKVYRTVIVAGDFTASVSGTPGIEWNVSQDPASAANVALHWPRPIEWVDYSVGIVTTAGNWTTVYHPSNPFRQAYWNGAQREVWDSVGPLHTVNPGVLLESSASGVVTINPSTGNSSFSAGGHAQHSYWTLKASSTASVVRAAIQAKQDGLAFRGVASVPTRLSWSFGLSGTSQADGSGNGYIGTATATGSLPTTSSGILDCTSNGYVGIGRNNARIQITSPGAALIPSGSQSWTARMWFNVPQTLGNWHFLAGVYNGGTWVWALTLTPGNVFNFAAFPGTYFNLNAGSYGVTSGATWHRMAVQQDVSANKTRLFVNGRRFEASGVLSGLGTAGNFSVGGNASTTESANCKIYKFEFIPYAIDPQELEYYDMVDRPV